jgi:hypothetical protein
MLIKPGYGRVLLCLVFGVLVFEWILTRHPELLNPVDSEGRMTRKGCHAEALEACGQRPQHHA